MRSQKISEYNYCRLGSSQSDSEDFKTWTPKISTFNSEFLKSNSDFVIFEENSQNLSKSSTPCRDVSDDSGTGNENVHGLVPGIDESILLERYGDEGNWREAVKKSARRVKVMENGEEILDCTWTEMKLRYLMWKEQKSKNLFHNAYEVKNLESKVLNEIQNTPKNETSADTPNNQIKL